MITLESLHRAHAHGQGVWRRWRAALSVAVMDQAISSGAMFIAHLLMARWVPPTEYGAFAVAFAILVVVSAPHSAMLADPLGSIGPREFAGNYLPYLRTAILLHGILTAPLCILVVAIALWFGDGILALEVALILAASMPFVLLLWLMRAAAYLVARPGIALGGSATFASVLLALIIAAESGYWLSAGTALLIMGAASALGSMYMIWRLGLGQGSWDHVPVRRVITEHWIYGRWILGAAFSRALAYGAYVPWVGLTVGLDGAAVLRALQNLVLPLERISASIGMVLYPRIAGQVSALGLSYLARRGLVFVAASLALAGCYAGVLAVFGNSLMVTAYGPGYYSAFASLVPLLAISAVTAALPQALSVLARARNEPDCIFWSNTAAAVWFLAAGLALVITKGVTGAMVAVIGGHVVEGLVLSVMLRKSSLASTEA